MCEEAIGHLIPSYALLQVDGKQVFGLVSAKGVAVHGHARGGGKLYLYVGFVYAYGIVAGLHGFVVVAQLQLFLFFIGNGQQGMSPRSPMPVPLRCVWPKPMITLSE